MMLLGEGQCKYEIVQHARSEGDAGYEKKKTGQQTQVDCRERKVLTKQYLQPPALSDFPGRYCCI